MRNTAMSGKLCLLMFVFACHAGSSSTAAPPTSAEMPTAPPAATGATTPAPQIEAGGAAAGSTPTAGAPKPPASSAPKLPAIGEPCGANDACAAGLACVHYYGIAGKRGPEFTSCEIRCGDGATCPKGLACITIADGPGRVCR